MAAAAMGTAAVAGAAHRGAGSAAPRDMPGRRADVSGQLFITALRTDRLLAASDQLLKFRVTVRTKILIHRHRFFPTFLYEQRMFLKPEFYYKPLLKNASGSLDKTRKKDLSTEQFRRQIIPKKRAGGEWFFLKKNFFWAGIIRKKKRFRLLSPIFWARRSAASFDF